MNSAFDQLFAAAADPAMSAIIEAKMATEAAALATSVEEQQQHSLSKKNSISRSRNGSFRHNAGGGSFRRAGSRTPNESIDSKSTLNVGADNSVNLTASGSVTPTNPKRFSNNLKIDGNAHLGAPQALTRSCSCKRPGSLKKMKSKNASPNRSPLLGTTPIATTLNEVAGDDAFRILNSRGNSDSKHSLI